VGHVGDCGRSGSRGRDAFPLSAPDPSAFKSQLCLPAGAVAAGAVAEPNFSIVFLAAITTVIVVIDFIIIVIRVTYPRRV
jgi:hypothetical protein